MTIERHFTVTGMSCAGCVAAVQKTLTDTEGVERAEVNLLEGQTIVRYHPDIVTPEALKAKVQAMGYDMLIEVSAKERDAIRESTTAKELAKTKQRMIGTITLTLLTMVLELLWGGTEQGMAILNPIFMVISAFIYFWAGESYHRRTLKQLLHRTPLTMDTLISMSTTVALFYSIGQYFYTLYTPSGAGQLFANTYFGEVGMIYSFVLVGRYVEERAKYRTQDALHALLSLAPEVALVKEGTQIFEKDVAQLQVGDTILLRKGDRVPVDGLLDAPAILDESSITGESLPVDKQAGEEIYAGTISLGEATTFSATKVGDETLLGRIVEAVRKAQASKAPIQRVADRVSAIFVPTVLLIALAVFLYWGLLSGITDGWSHGLYFAITILVIACPCALGLATPTAITVAMGTASKSGLLIRDATALEQLSKVTDVIYDKTGTLTEGRPHVTTDLWLTESEQETSYLRALLVRAEQHSGHPLGKAIISAYPTEVSLQEIEVKEVAGAGLEVGHQGKHYRIGNAAFALHEPTETGTEATSFSQAHPHATLIYFSEEDKLKAIIAIDDAIRPKVPDALASLQKQHGVTLHLLSGDRQERVKHFAEKVGIAHAEGALSPLDKKDYIEQLQATGKVIAMVGDGINDSPALATADISVAIGSGSDIANEVAMLTSISGSPYSIERAITLSKKSLRVIHQNFFWAFIYNILAIPLAAGLFYPHLYLTPTIAAAAMAFSSISVVLNSLRLRTT